MIEKVTIFSKAFEIDHESKLATQKWVRQSIFPKLIEKRLPAEISLLTLHNTSTWRLSNQEALSPDQCRQKTLDQIRILGIKNKDIQITPSIKKDRGTYRLLSDIKQKGINGEEIKQHIWSFRAIDIITSQGSFAYIAPQQEIDSLMYDLCQIYDSLETKSNNPVDVALRLAFMYGIGENIIHPFLDGNHRAFDRFLEYGFEKAGIEFKLPQDNTANIPAEEIFRVSLANLTVNFLIKENLTLFKSIPPDHIHRDYQRRLTGGIKRLVQKQFTDPRYLWFYAKIAGELLKWTPDDHAKEILNMQEKAQRDGGFEILHRRK
jgi:hypothetical protein